MNKPIDEWEKEWDKLPEVIAFRKKFGNVLMERVFVPFIKREISKAEERGYAEGYKYALTWATQKGYADIPKEEFLPSKDIDEESTTDKG